MPEINEVEVPIAEEQAEDNNNDSNNNPNSGLFDGGLWSTFAAAITEEINEEEKPGDPEMMSVSMDSLTVDENLNDAGNDDENSFPEGFMDTASGLLQVELGICLD